MGWECLDWFCLAQARPSDGLRKRVLKFRFHKIRELLDSPLKKNSLGPAVRCRYNSERLEYCNSCDSMFYDVCSKNMV
jgi:hypothetical protein